MIDPQHEGALVALRDRPLQDVAGLIRRSRGTYTGRLSANGPTWLLLGSASRNDLLLQVDWSLDLELQFYLALPLMWLAVAGIVYGIYRMLKAPKNRVIARDGVEITLENLEEYLHETDLERFLREALEKGDYPLVIRLYYLQIIKSLSEKNAIRWSKEKTNRDYLRETREHRMGEQFRIVTRTYERVWYGNQSLTLHEFGRLEPQFKNLIASL